MVSQRTLALIQQRSEARASNNRQEERRLLKEVRKSCKIDKTEWMDSNIALGCWDGIRRFCRPRQHKQGRLQNLQGRLVASHERADTVATYLEQVQWKVRQANLVDNEALGPPLPVDESAFTVQEVGKAMQKLKWGKAAGLDDIPAEYWKAISQTPGGLKWVTELCNSTWAEHRVPEAWRHATVSTIYKNKGPIHMCENYRPINLLCVA
jgi:hypothetical protein